MGYVFLDELKSVWVNVYKINGDLDEIEHVANGVIHPVTKETITEYQKLVDDPLLQKVWSEAMAKELGILAQGYGDVKGTDTVQFLDHDGIRRIPKDRTITYERIVVDYCAHKADSNRV